MKQDKERSKDKQVAPKPKRKRYPRPIIHLCDPREDRIGTGE